MTEKDIDRFMPILKKVHQVLADEKIGTSHDALDFAIVLILDVGYITYHGHVMKAIDYALATLFQAKIRNLETSIKDN